MPRFSKILCPVDFDQGGPSALRLAAELAAERKAVLHVLHVVDIPPNVEAPLPFAEMEARAEMRLAQLTRQRIGPKVRCRLHVTIGGPSQQVLFTAKQLGADLIVLATHGRKGLRRLV